MRPKSVRLGSALGQESGLAHKGQPRESPWGRRLAADLDAEPCLRKADRDAVELNGAGTLNPGDQEAEMMSFRKGGSGMSMGRSSLGTRGEHLRYIPGLGVDPAKNR